MIRVHQKLLSQYIENFNTNNIEVIMNGTFKQTTKLQNAKLTYNMKNGKLKIHDNNTSLEINISFVDSMIINKELNKLKLYLDDDIEITIVKLSDK